MLNKLGQIVRKCYGPETPAQRRSNEGEFAEIEFIINSPTYSLLDTDGHSYTWVQDLTRPATPEETTAYWKQRAINAEAKLNRDKNDTLA